MGDPSADEPVAIRIVLQGRVQGVGMRPTVARIAKNTGVHGSVANFQGGAVIHAEGAADVVEKFRQCLADAVERGEPANAVVTSIAYSAAECRNCQAFSVELECDDGTALSTCVPPDRATCDSCRADARLGDRRESYPFVSCIDCGPRYSIIERMPYERSRTSMRAFSMCPECLAEYQRPSDRRFHAETNACRICGPQVWCCDARGQRTVAGREALDAVAHAIVAGQIVAVRGEGGFQLLADATQSATIRRLRKTKLRPGKPFSVMAPMETLEQVASLRDHERRLLQSPEAPIVIVDATEETSLALEVSGGLSTLGLMTPTTALHELLLDRIGLPVVCTSGNLDGDAIEYSSCVPPSLQSIADLFLMHDRPIDRPVDDSVVRSIAGRTVGVRLGRGYAPLSLPMSPTAEWIAAGGHLKSSIALANASQAVLAPHIGSLNTISARERYVEQTRSLKDLYGLTSHSWVTDLHPDYFSTVFAERNQGEKHRAQHHHAHVVAGMLEHQWLDREVIGVAFDGVGYGSDGTAWGGEFLRATRTAFERVAHLRPMPLPGGDRAATEPWRMAAALVFEAGAADRRQASPQVQWRVERLWPLLNSKACPRTTSVGRLFDGVASLALGIQSSQFEGQAAMLLESACDRECEGSYEFRTTDHGPMQLDWRPVVLNVVRDCRLRVPVGQIAMKFHRAVAKAVLTTAKLWSPLPIVLAGGVFQNRILVEQIAMLWEDGPDRRQPLGLPGIIPPNDGGLAAGQLAIVAGS